MSYDPGVATMVQITFDAADPHALARWWADRLGYEIEVRSEMVQQLLDAGAIGDELVVRIDGELFFADAVAASDPAGAAPRLLFQRVPEPKTAKNRVHLDVPVPQEDLDAHVDEWTTTGAALVRFDEYPGHRWAVMHDPEGNEFCLH